MSPATTKPTAVVLSSSWRRPESELSFVTRSVAAALSRHAVVTVVVPMPVGTGEADGAFDLIGIGEGPGSGWPDARKARWPRPPEPDAMWILDHLSESAHALQHAFGAAGSAYFIAPPAREPSPSLRQLVFTPDAAATALGMHVPVNPLAGTHRHAGLGFTGYILVLTNRPSTPPAEPPTPAVAWLTSRFHDRYVVVVEGGSAAVWKGRALRGVISVDTRTDFWRLLAHSAMTVDLAPGEIIARECIESLRFGAPIVVPSGTVGAKHAASGGGLAFSDTLELLECVDRLLDGTERKTFARHGNDYAESLFGDPATFVTNISRLIARS
jgi:hypothetical protein